MAVRKGLLISGALLVVLILCAVCAAAGINYLLRPVDAAVGEGTVRVEIAPGASTGKIASILAEKGVIRSALLFRIYARYHRLDQKFMAGSYDLKLSMSLPEIAAKIASGDVDMETHWFTIPEGYFIEEIAHHLDEAGLIDGERFLELAASPPPHILERFPFIGESAANSQVIYVLEGYLFPDTYEIAAGSTEEEIISLMLRRFETIFSDELQRRCAELEMTLHEALTLASIIEGEAVVEHERKLIAGVFHNRLGINMQLQACATVQYILPERKENLSYADTQTPSPYNTYINFGLPPGPVGAPGEASILAALYPENTEYKYFVSKKDGSGEHYFSRTNSEHEKYKAIADENERKRQSEQ
ncbi:MAG TPA: endolytic transglycosylase MltG [Bacillota bacterium]|nr:endolytic transglycosylase MltG [Bacillota bacterium]